MFNNYMYIFLALETSLFPQGDLPTHPALPGSEGCPAALTAPYTLSPWSILPGPYYLDPTIKVKQTLGQM